MKKLAFISDLVFTFCISFLFTLCFFRFLSVGFFVAILLSALCGGLTTCAFAAFLQARRKKFFLKKSDAENKDKLLLHLALLPKDKLTDYFLHYFQSVKREASPVRHADLQLSVGDSLYFLHFRIAAATADDVADIFRMQTKQQKILLCSNADPQAKSLCEKLRIKLWTGEDVYAALKEADALPQTYLGESEKKKGRLKPQLWFAKTNARRFLTSAAMLLFLSFLTPFFYYYLIFGSVLLLAALLVRIFGYEQHSQSR